MQLSLALRSSGILQPADMELLRTVYDKTHLESDTDVDRETRAAALIRLFSSGMRSEAELLKALGYDPNE